MLEYLVIGEAKPNTTLGTIIVVSGAFLILMLLIKKFAWESITTILKQREDKIANDLDSAEQSRIAATELEKERQQKLTTSKVEAAEIMQRAKETGEQNRLKILKDTNLEIVELKEKAKEDLAQEHQEVLASIKEEVADLSLQIAEKILVQELTPVAHENLIDSFIESLGNSDETR